MRKTTFTTKSLNERSSDVKKITSTQGRVEPKTAGQEQTIPIPTVGHMNFNVRKPVFGVSDQVRHKPSCTTTEVG